MIAVLIPYLSGYRPLYRAGTICPCCASSHWIIGRFSAECHRCATALPLASPAVGKA